MERPAYSIRIEDLGDRVAWTLDRDEEEVADGSCSVEATLGGLDQAFRVAWTDADATRRERAAQDLEDAQRTVEAEEAAWQDHMTARGGPGVDHPRPGPQ